MHSTYVEYYLAAFQDVLGLELEISEYFDVSPKNMETELVNLNLPSIEKMILPLEKVLLKNYEGITKNKNIFLKNEMITEYIYSILEKDASKYQKLDFFINHLQTLSTKTYEGSPCKMSFIVFDNEVGSIRNRIEKLGFRFLEFKERTSVENILKEKMSLKLVDSLSISYVTNQDYEIIGLAVKQSERKSINQTMKARFETEEHKVIKKLLTGTQESTDALELMNKISKGVYESLLDKKNEELSKKVQNYLKNLSSKNKALESENIKKLNLIIEEKEKYNSNIYIELQKNLKIEKEDSESSSSDDEREDNIQFVQIDKNRIEWYLHDSFICVLSNGKWKIQNHDLIAHNILLYLYKKRMMTAQNEKIEEMIKSFYDFYRQIKNLSQKNIGALFVIFENKDKQMESVYKDILIGEKINNNEYSRVIRNREDKVLSINDCDIYLIELISSVDGAVLLDQELNILSFGEMIKNNATMTTSLEAGARTQAAVQSSYHGLSIKVSEDGDISVFIEGKSIIRM